MKINNIIDYFFKTKQIEVINQQAKTEGSTVNKAETHKYISRRNNPGEQADNIEITYKDAKLLDGLYDGWNFIFEIYEEPISLDIIKFINLKVSDTTNNKPGVIRRENNIHVYIDEKTIYKPDIPNIEEIENKIKEINQIDDPVKKSLELFTFISRAKLFENCNKRTAYLTANIPIIKSDLAILYPTNEKNNDFLKILTEYYLNPTEINKEKCHDFLKVNYLSNQELDMLREDNDNSLTVEDVDNLIKQRVNLLENREQQIKQTEKELLSRLKTNTQ